MPSTLPITTVEDFRQRFHRGVRAKRDRRADGHTGSAYDYVAGTSAMLLAREAPYIRDLFQATYKALAVGDDLTELIAGRYNIDRILDTYGTGTLTMKRPTNVGGGDTLWAGTRVAIQGAGTTGLAYAIAEDTPIDPSAVYAAGIPIRATKLGSGYAIDTATSGQPAVFDDPIYDNSWAVTSVRCDDGTDFEQASAFRARVASVLRASTVGYATGMTAACVAVGAANVTVFGTNYAGQDLHACAVYVGDDGFNGSDALVLNAKRKLESWRMLGADMLIGRMVSTPLAITATATLYDDPSKFDRVTLDAACKAAIRRQFAKSDSYGYDLDAIFGAIANVTDAIQDVTFSLPNPPSQGLLVGSPPWFPQSLPRYFLPPSAISLTFQGP